MKTIKWVCMMVSVFGMTGLLQAQSYTNIVSGNWSDSASWKDSRIPPGGSTNLVYFDNAAADASVNNLPGAFVLNNLTFTRGFAVTLSGNDLSFTNNGTTLPQVYQNVNIANSIANNITLATNTTFYVNNNTLTATGVISGQGPLSKTGATALSLAASNTYSGATTVSAGTLTLNGVNGAISSSSILLNGGKLNLDSTGSGNSNNNRVPDATTVGLGLGSELALTGNGTSGSTAEAIGTVTADRGGTITIGGTGAGTLQTLTVASLIRTNSGVVLVRGGNLGQASTAAARLVLSDTNGLVFVGGALPGAAGTAKTNAIIPYLVGDINAANAGNGFVTYDTTVNALRPLAQSEYTNLSVNGYISPPVPENAQAANVTLTQPSVTLNALAFNTGCTVNCDMGKALTIASGAIMANAANSVIHNQFSSLTLGDGTWNEGNIYTVQNLMIRSPVNVTGGGGLTKSGAGSLSMLASNLYTGVTMVNAGTLQLGDASTGYPAGALSGGVTLNLNTTLATSTGVNNPAPIAGVVTGLGGNITVNTNTLTLNSGNLPTGAMNSFGALTLNTGGKLVLNGSTASTNVFASVTSASGGKFYFQEGLNSFTAYSPASAFAYQTGGDIRLNSFMLTSSRGYYRLAGGTLSSLGLGAAGSFCAVANSGIGVLDICGGSLSVLAGGGTAGFNLARGTSGTGVVYQTSGTLFVKDSENFSAIGNNNCRGEYTLAGGVCTGGVGFAWTYNNSSGTAILNLNGGTLATKGFRWSIVAGGGIDSTVNFNGGVLQASAASTGTGYSPNASDFLRASNVFVYANGLIFDSNSYNLTIARTLQAPTGKGVTALPPLPGGAVSGYSGAPYVEITGGSGKGATGAALFDYTTGNVTGLVVTCAGRDYQDGDLVAVTLKGGGVADNALGSAPIGAITSGGLTKLGAGTLTLSGTNTFTGATIVSAGTLSLSHTNVLPAAADVYITGGAKVNLSAGTHTIRKLYVDFVLQPKALLGTNKLSNALSGPGFFYPTQGRAGTIVMFM